MRAPSIPVCPMGAPLRLGTSDLDARDCIAVWRDLYGRKLFNLDIEPFGPDPFRAEITLRTLPTVKLSAGRRSDTHTHLRKHHLANAGDMVMMIAMLEGRAWCAQRGRDVVIEPNQAVAMLTSETATMTLTGGGSYVGVYVARPLLRALVPDLDARLMTALPPGRDALGLLIDYVRLLQGAGPLTTEQVQRSASNHIVDLLVLSLTEKGEPAEAARQGGLRAARMRAVKADIAAHLQIPRLSAEDVARRQGVSPDYVRKLFRLEGTSFADHVLEARLTSIYRALADPGLAARPIGTIAYGAGFSDVSYFNRRFRQRFGMTPSDVRRAASFEQPRE